MVVTLPLIYGMPTLRKGHETKDVGHSQGSKRRLMQWRRDKLGFLDVYEHTLVFVM